MAADDLQDFHPGDFLHEDDPYRGLSPSPAVYKPLLNDARLLFVLATEPSRVLPEGKSLASVFSEPSETTQKPRSALEEQIAEMVHQAFWEEAIRSLSAEQSATMIRRLGLFYYEIHNMLEPILPPDNSIMRLLSSPLPPTSSPLRSSRNDLRLILEELRKVCAPVRDPEVDAALAGTYSSDLEEDLPALLVSTLRSTMQLIEEMRSDIRNFTLANLEEETLKKLLVSEARRREVLLVARLYGGEQGITKPWVDWISSPLASTITPLPSMESARTKAWIPILMKGLSSFTPVSVVRPSFEEDPSEYGVVLPNPSDLSGGLTLPPPFLIPLPSLFRIQDLTQALVVTACLRIIAQSAIPRTTPNTPTKVGSRTPFPSTPTRASPIPRASIPTSPSTSSLTPSPSEALEEFTGRVWSLVEHEVERGGHVEAETKLVNLEDEVWRLRKQYLAATSTTSSISKTSSSSNTSRPSTPTRTSSISSNFDSATPLRSQSPARTDPEEQRVRAQVRQLLRLDDKVFNLLQTRLIKALTEWLTSPPPSSQSKNHAGPVHMRTGMRRPGTLFATSPSWGDPNAPESRANAAGVAIPTISSLPVVPGFEGRVLRKALEDVARDLAVVVGWVKETWGGVVALEPRPSPVAMEGGEVAPTSTLESSSLTGGALTTAVPATGSTSTGDDRRAGATEADKNATTSTTPSRRS